MAPCVERLVLVGRSPDRLSSVAISSNSVAVQADISTEAGRNAVLGAISGMTISWLVIASGVPLRGSVSELDPDAIVNAITTNLLGPVLLIQQLLAQDWGRGGAIVVIGSISASRALPNRAVYGATKAGLEHFATALAAELAPRGIRVNVVAPGVIDTPFLGDNRKILTQWIEDRVPARRLGDADEVARVVKYAVVDAPDYLTGSRIAVDGGAEAVG